MTASASTAAALRAAFDAAFAEPLPTPPPATIAVLRVRVGGRERELALASIASLHADLVIAPLPSRAPALLGVAAVRGEIVPIYDLGAALGGASAGPRPRWIALARGGAAGVAFDELRGHARVDPARAAAADDVAAAIQKIENEESR